MSSFLLLLRSPVEFAPLNILVMKATKPQCLIWIGITPPLDLLVQSFLTLIERFFFRIWQKFIIYNNSWPLSWPKSVVHCLELSVLMDCAELSKNSMQDQIAQAAHTSSESLSITIMWLDVRQSSAEWCWGLKRFSTMTTGLAVQIKTGVLSDEKLI